MAEESKKLPWIYEKRPWRWEEDGLTATRGGAFTGPGCHEGCGVILYTNKEGKLVKVEGDPDNNYNQGRLCLRCLALPEVVNHPDRVKYPMKRIGKRGSNKWERISWDQAVDEITERLGKIREEHGAESVIFAQGTGRDIAPYIERLSFSFGSPNYVCMGLSGNSCYIPRISLQFATHGSAAMADSSQYWRDRYEDPKYKVPECIIIWGHNPLVSNSDGNLGHWYVELMKRGSKLICVDPRMTWWASRADIWLQIRPGTDSALALGMLNVIIKEELYDKDFVDKWTYGFDKLAERVKEYPVERVAEITWAPKEKIIEAARMYAKAKPGMLVWGLAIDMTREALPAAHALTALWDITGNLDIPGGNMLVEPPCGVDSYFGWGFDLISPEQFEKRIGMDKYPLLRYGIPLAQPDELIETMLTDKPYPLKACWFQSNNPLACMSADPRKLYKALSRLEFVVVVDLFMTPTATAFADYVLPCAAYPERDGHRAVFYSLQTINKVTQTGECKSDMEINRLIGGRLDPEAWPWKNEEEAWDALMSGSGLTFKEIRDRHQLLHPFAYKKYEIGRLRSDGQPGFNTPTGRIELYSTKMEEFGLDPLPYFEEPTEGPVSTPELMKEYPLILTTGRRAWGFFHSEHRQIKSLRSTHPWPKVQINPETAVKYGIREGDWVWIENSMGKCRQTASITPVVPPWMVMADHGWWYPEEDGAEPNLFGVWKSNVNQLVPLLPGRSGFGGNYKSLICKIYKVKEGEM